MGKLLWALAMVFGLGTVADATLAIIEPGAPTLFYWNDQGKTHYRQCTVPPFTEADLLEFSARLLPTCNADAAKYVFSVDAGTYSTSLGAFYGIPHRFFDVSPESAMADAFMQQEREFRRGSTTEQSDPVSELFFRAYEHVLDHLPLDKAKILGESDVDFSAIRQAATAAFTSTYSNGRTAVVQGKTVTAPQIWTACKEGWAPLALETAQALLAEDGDRLRAWYGTVNSRSYSQVMVWQETFTEKQVRDGSSAHQKRFETLSLNLQNQTTNSASGNTLYPTLCIRRENRFTQQGRMFARNGTLTLAQVAQRYELAPEVFYGKILKVEALEEAFAPFHLSNEKMSEAELARIRPLLDATLGFGLVDWDSAEATAIAEEKRRMQAEAEQARLLAKAEQEQKKREAQWAWEQQQQAARDRYAEQQRQYQQQQELAQQRREQAARSQASSYGTNTDRTTYYDNLGNVISKEQHDQMMNKYNAHYYGQYFTDAAGNPISKEKYDALNAAAGRSSGGTGIYRSSGGGINIQAGNTSIRTVNGRTTIRSGGVTIRTR